MNPLQRIIKGGYCIGCGACHAATEGAVPVILNEFGQFQADSCQADDLSDAMLSKALQACPFSDEGPNEDELGNKLFGAGCRQDEQIGYYHQTHIGHVDECDFRATSTSGGVLTWVLTELLRLDRIDAVAHVQKKTSPADGVLFRYGISRTVEEVRAGAKSRYYPVEMSSVLRQIKETPGRYAVVGLPCFIKAVRRLAAMDPVIQERVVFCIGLVCGHLKSKAFGDCFACQAGIPAGQLEEIDFRVKLPDQAASDYGVYLRGAGKEITRPTREFFGSNWGYNFFRYAACNCCDDVFAETADMTIGDAWLPEYHLDPKGTCIVVLRTRELSELIEQARQAGRLTLVPSTPRQMAESQAGGLRDRREGLAYRLYLKQQAQEWAPAKRIKPNKSKLSRQRARIYRLRARFGTESHVAWKDAMARDEYRLFEKRMQPYVRKLQRAYRPWIRTGLRGIKKLLSRLLRWFR